MKLINHSVGRSMRIQSRAFLNCCLAEYYYGRRKITLRNKPRILAIEPTNFCNLNCLMCSRGFMKRKIGFMDFGLFKKIINQIKGYVGFVWLHHFGEPLFHPRLREFINHCAENNIRAGLSTNATVLDEEKAVMLLNSKLNHIILSMNGSRRATDQTLREGSDFEKTRDNIINFLRLKKKLNKARPFAEVQIIKMELTEEEIGVFKRQWKGLADNVLIKDFTAWANQVEVITELQREQHLCYSRRGRRYPCLAFWRDAVILWNGDLVPCCMDFDGKIVLGNLGRERLEDIWNSDRVKRIRKEHAENNYSNPLCENCMEWYGSQKDPYYLFLKVLPYSIKLFKKYLCLYRRG